MFQKVNVTNKKASGIVSVPQSTAVVHRLLILNALSAEHIDLAYSNTGDDVLATKRCLEDLGLPAGEDYNEEDYLLCGLNCSESGSTYRFLLPIASALGKNCRFKLEGSLLNRPMDNFFRILRTHGVKKSDFTADMVNVSGNLTPGTFILAGDTDGQLLSGLLMALPLLKENSTVIVENVPESEKYVNLTISLMEACGVHVSVLKDQDRVKRTYKVSGDQIYQIPSDFHLEADWTIAAYVLTAGAISRMPVTCTNMNLNSLQGDKLILKILTAFGVHVLGRKHEEIVKDINNEEISLTDVAVTASELKATRISAEGCPDLLGCIAALACASEGVSLITNINSLRAGSTDRISLIRRAITILGGQISETEEGLVIIGCGENGLRGGNVDCGGDPYVTMMCGILSCICSDTITLSNTASINKIYPDFFKMLDELKK